MSLAVCYRRHTSCGDASSFGNNVSDICPDKPRNHGSDKLNTVIHWRYQCQNLPLQIATSIAHTGQHWSHHVMILPDKERYVNQRYAWERFKWHALKTLLSSESNTKLWLCAWRDRFIRRFKNGWTEASNGFGELEADSQTRGIRCLSSELSCVPPSLFTPLLFTFVSNFLISFWVEKIGRHGRRTISSLCRSCLMKAL